MNATMTVTMLAAGTQTLRLSGNSYFDFVFTVTAPPETTPSFTAAAPPTSGAEGSAYAGYSFRASGGGVAFAVATGALPPGLTLDANGALSGTPTAAGTYTFTVSATNTAGTTTTSPITIIVAESIPVFTAAAPPTSGAEGSAYAGYSFRASGGGVAFAVATGALPPGLTLDANGALSGTPTAAGTYTFTVSATNTAGTTTTSPITIIVAESIPVFTAAAPPTSGAAGSAYAGYSFTASGGGVAFAVATGALPPGLTLAANGALSGTPTAAGTYTFTVSATNTAGTTTTSPIIITITVAPAPSPTPDNGDGASESTPSPTPPAQTVPVMPVDSLAPITNKINGNVPMDGVPIGASLLLVNGQATPVTVVPNARSNPSGLDVRGDGWFMKLAGRGDSSDPLGLAEKSVLILESQQVRTRAKSVQPVAVASGSGFKASSEVRFYLLPNTLLGTLTTNADGTFAGSVPVPAGIAPGSYTLQMNGYSPASQVRSLSIGVLVKAAETRMRTAKASVRVLFAPLSSTLTPTGKAQLKALVNKTGRNAIEVISVGFVQDAGGSLNDQSLSTARAKNVATFLRSLRLSGAYVVQGDGVGGTEVTARKVMVTVTYRTK